MDPLRSHRYQGGNSLSNANNTRSDLEQFRPCLDLAAALVAGCLGQLYVLCGKEGRLQPTLLDAHQQLCYDLAFCSAELQAARVMLDYAQAEASTSVLAADVAIASVADSVFGIQQRLLAHAGAPGLSRAELMKFIAAPACTSLLDEWLAPARLAAIGEQALALPGLRLPTQLDAEKEMVRSTFARFAEEQVMPVAEQVHRQDLDIPQSLIDAAAALGCFGTCIPERFGGLMPDERADCLGMIVVTEELSRGSLGAAGSLITRPEIAARALLAGGTEAQQQSWLPRLASAEVLAAIAVTEPDYGSDVASVVLRATAVDGGWLLNGSKTWCTFAGKADVLVTLARSNEQPGHRGLSLFLVEKPPFAGHEFDHQQDAGGRISGRAIATLGYRGMHSYDIFFEDFFVPDTHLLGGAEGEGKGFYHAMAGFAGGRIQTAARATGVMQAALERALDYAAQRKVFGAAVADYQLTRVKLARMLMKLTASRQFSYSVARQLDTGGGKMEASLVKLYTCRAAEWVTREAMQIHGGMGYAEESAVSRYFVDARVLSIFEGAEETLALKVIARDLVANAGQD